MIDSATAKISGRGVITSRTSMSPNSTAERTSSRVALLKDAFFLAGLDQRVHVGRGLFFGVGRRLGQRRHRKEEADEDRDRRCQPQQHRDRPQQPRRPQPARAVEEQRRNELVRENHHQHHAENGLRDLRRVGSPGGVAG